MIKVSIILPVYNVEPYLDETMQSLIQQTLTDIEIIAVNDGSSDGSKVVLEKYKQQDVVFERREEQKERLIFS